MILSNALRLSVHARRAALVSAAIACGLLLASGAQAQTGQTVGERPAIESHMSQAAIDAGSVTLHDVLAHGRALFGAQWNSLDGRGRPLALGNFTPRPDPGPEHAFTRISAPDGSSCADCHHHPIFGGTAGFAGNAFFGAAFFDPVVTDVTERNRHLERGSLGVMGLGAVEAVAREMSAELGAQRAAALAQAAQTATPVATALSSKGVNFGSLVAHPDGRIDPTGIHGVDYDLVVKPFLRGGLVSDLRFFTNVAFNNHFGIASVEFVGAGNDNDGDGVVDEMSIGDVTAATLWMAANPVPRQVLAEPPDRRRAVRSGERLFEQVGCTGCHRPALELASQIYVSTPAPGGGSISLDMGDRDGVGLDRDLGRWIVRLFSDLKRHNLCDPGIDTPLCREELQIQSLAGTADPAAFTVAPGLLPRNTRLTSKLWDVGSTGPYGNRNDVTTLTEIIGMHRGDASAQRNAFLALPAPQKAELIEFLKSLQIVAR